VNQASSKAQFASHNVWNGAILRLLVLFIIIVFEQISFFSNFAHFILTKIHKTVATRAALLAQICTESFSAGALPQTPLGDSIPRPLFWGRWAPEKGKRKGREGKEKRERGEEKGREVEGKERGEKGRRGEGEKKGMGGEGVGRVLLETFWRPWFDPVNNCKSPDAPLQDELLS